MKSMLSIIVVNYNTVDMLRKCLRSIALQRDIPSQVIVVDNASTDGSRKMVRGNFPWIKLINNSRNLGFARANNIGINIATGKYLYFLNPDTEVKPDALPAMIEFMQSNPDIGLAGTRIVNPNGTSQSSVEVRYPGERYARRDLEGLKGDIAWVLGASMIARHLLIKEIGGFDERFFLYGEDIDLCLSIRKYGWRIGYIPQATIVHWGGQSEKNSLPAEVWKKKFKAEFLFYEKHYSAKAIWGIKVANIAQALWRILTLRIKISFSSDRETDYLKLNRYEYQLTYFWKKRVQGKRQ